MYNIKSIKHRFSEKWYTKNPSSYRSLYLLDTIGKVAEIVLARTISDLRSHGLLRDEQVEFRFYSRTSEKQDSLFARFNRSFDE